MFLDGILSAKNCNFFWNLRRVLFCFSSNFGCRVARINLNIVLKSCCSKEWGTLQNSNVWYHYIGQICTDFTVIFPYILGHFTLFWNFFVCFSIFEHISEHSIKCLKAVWNTLKRENHSRWPRRASNQFLAPKSI